MYCIQTLLFHTLRFNTFPVFSEYGLILAMYSPYMFKYFALILRNMQKEWRLRRKKLLLLTMPDKVKWALFRENQMGDHKLAYSEHITN
jgi:hypothetical protein